GFRKPALQPLWNRSGFPVEERVVEEAGEESAEERADPVDALIGPVICSERRAESAGGIECTSGEGASNDYAEGNDKADAKAGVGANGVALVDGSRENGEHQKESCDGFKGETGQHCEIASEAGSAKRDGAPNFIGNDGAKEKRCCDGAHNLRNPVRD